jgi:hypothetical protein
VPLITLVLIVFWWGPGLLDFGQGLVSQRLAGAVEVSPVSGGAFNPAVVFGGAAMGWGSAPSTQATSNSPTHRLRHVTV